MERNTITGSASVDVQTLCKALGFTAVVMKDRQQTPEGARQALSLAYLIESFCAYGASPGGAVNENGIMQADTVIEALKADLRRQGSADLQRDRASLLLIYDRLRQRYVTYADDDALADRVLELLDAELEHDEER